MFNGKAIDYLISRDEDNDGLLEQDHNEDWMDTILRSGKKVYSQACLLLALTDFTVLLLKVGREEDAQKLMINHGNNSSCRTKIMVRQSR